MPPNTELPCPKPGLCPNAGGLLWPNTPAPVLAEDWPNEKEMELLALEEAPKTFPLVDVEGADPDCPKADPELKPGWLKEKLLAGLLVDCPKAGACPKAVCPKTPVADVPKAGLPNPELLAGGVAVAVLAVLPVCCPNRLGAVLAAACPNTGVAEGVEAVLPGSWLKAELELAAGG